MSSTTDKISGLANEAVGNVKQAVGHVTGSEKLQAEGKAQELKGDAEKAVGDTKSAAGHAADKVSDRAEVGRGTNDLTTGRSLDWPVFL